MRSSDDPTNRMRAWAAEHGYRELGARPCVHGLLYGRCRPVFPYFSDCYVRCSFLDHVRIWRTRDGGRFLLAHSYASPPDIEAAAAAYAAEHGLRWAVLPEDDWYGFGTTPIRLWRDPSLLAPVNPRTRRPTFPSWLRAQRGRDDPVGAFARAARAAHLALGRCWSWAAVQRALDAFAPGDAAMLAAAQAAWHEWRQTVGLDP